MRSACAISASTSVVGAADLYAQWVQLPRALRTRGSRTWLRPSEGASQAYLDGVFSTSWPTALEFASAHEFGGVRRVLDIGGGWGSFLQFAGEQGVHVTSITISDESQKTMQELIRRAPEQWHLQSPNWPSDYDALEAIGHPHPRPGEPDTLAL